VNVTDFFPLVVTSRAENDCSFSFSDLSYGSFSSVTTFSFSTDIYQYIDMAQEVRQSKQPSVFFFCSRKTSLLSSKREHCLSKKTS
jgi:hypothetical protein